jgi:hypothetical protein
LYPHSEKRFYPLKFQLRGVGLQRGEVALEGYGVGHPKYHREESGPSERYKVV